LFEKLRALRRALADKAGIPPYVIAHDTVLIEMASAKPRTPEELLAIKGMGEKRVKKYGPLFLAVIAGKDPSVEC
jgi:ATP-dependent DNA helicase RecQ